MPTQKSTVIQLLIAVATLPFVFEFIARAIAAAVSESTSQNPVLRLLRTSYGPVMEVDESPRKFARRMAIFWLKIAAALTCILIIINQIVVWTSPSTTDGVTYGAFVYVIGPMLVGACLLRSVMFVIYSFRLPDSASNYALERTRGG
jgi:hypothetical protein